ncbi:hypothetical protein [Streptomyces sp. NPDC051001]|uniref:hypothetical protein n=1 Tax=Streptomyces sp. NPDC051001 TaxID=3155795 RepID=UPI003430732A
MPLVIGLAEHVSWALYRLDRKEYGYDLGADAFLYTRAAVVAVGRTEFDSVLQDPSAFTPYALDLIWAEPLLGTPDGHTNASPASSGTARPATPTNPAPTPRAGLTERHALRMVPNASTVDRPHGT